jgi:amino acid adenylation domain-containing protein
MTNKMRIPTENNELMAYPTKQKDEIGIEETHLQAQLSYWKQQLAGVPPVLELPTDRPRPPVQTFRSARRSQELPQTLTESLLMLSQKEEVSLFVTLLTAFKTLLYRYTGQEDILVGSPIINRNSDETEEPSSFKANTLVLRTQLQGNRSFSELLGRVREMVWEAYVHQDLPFEKLVEKLQPEPSLSYSPLFQVMFAWQNAQLEKLELPSLTITPKQQENLTSKFDLALSMEETDQRLLGSWEYNTDLFNAVTINRMAGHFQTMLEGIVAHPELPISELPLLTEAERHQQMVECNKTQSEYPQDKCVHQLFEEQVERTPDAMALVYQNEQLTYRELNTRANQLAHYLQGLGVGPDVLVGICVERSLEMVVGLLGILKAGGAYVPLDPTYPQERLAYMLSDSLLSVLLTQEKLVADLPEHTADVVCLDSQWGVISCESQENPVSGVQASNLAYVIYTSGSTGKPKGVLVVQQGLCNLAQAQIRLFDVNLDSRVLQFASFSFDASIWEVVMALCSGARLCLGTKKSLLPGPNLMQFLRTYNITHVTLPPSALAVVSYEELPALRTIVVAGEACSPDLVAQWSKNRRFFNAYGPTESTVCATVAEWTDSSSQPSIGRPIANTQIYILDSHLQPVPIGVIGELYIGGAGLARGYLNRPELTQEKFIVNPFSQEQGARLYKTGDLARYLPNDNIEFLGRIDQQVKIRGFRIELLEIEAILSQHPSVKQVLVIDREDVPGDKRLVAYIVHDQEQVPKVSELRCLLKEKLPDYMMPSAFVMLEAMPLTPNGKVNRKALPAPDTIRPDLEESFVSPRTTVEEVLAGIWSEVLRLKQIGIHDNFFHLGGHSLATTQILSRVRDVFQVELPFDSFFESPTIANLAKIIEQDNRGNQQLRFPPIQPISRNGNLPISFAQEGVCFIQQLAPKNTAYQAQATIRFTGDLDVKALQQSLREIVRRHEIFRTTFPTVNGQPVQVIHPPQPLNLPLIDFHTLPEDEHSTEVQRLLNAEFQKPFNPAQLPLVRWVLLRLSDSRTFVSPC